MFFLVFYLKINIFFALETKETRRKQSLKELISTDTWKRYSCLNNVSLTENCSEKKNKELSKNLRNYRIEMKEFKNRRKSKKLDETELKKHANFAKSDQKIIIFKNKR